MLFWPTVIFLTVCYFASSAWNARVLNNKTRKYKCKPGKVVSIWSTLRKSQKLDGGRLDMNWVTESMKERNTVISQSIGGRVFVTKDPENFKALLSTQFQDFTIGFRIQLLKQLMGNGIFVAQDQNWVHTRAMIRPQFSREKISHVHMLERHIPDLFRRIRTFKGKPYDFFQVISLYTITTSMDFVVGENIGTLRDGMENEKSFVGDLKWCDFANIFDLGQRIFYKRAWTMNTSMLTENVFKTAKVVNSLHSFFFYYVDKALALSPEEIEKKRAEGCEEVNSFLYELLSETRDRVVIRDHCIGILSAARDTTSSLLGWTIYFLAKNPRVLNKLRKEIEEKFGLGGDSRIEDITFETLKTCVYLRHVINEALRLCSPIALNTRAAKVDTTLPRGGGPDGQSPVFVAKGETIIMGTHQLHHRKDIYGEDVEDFRPERWEDSKVKSWEFIPFWGGPRVCLGQQFALTEAYYVVIRLLQEFPSLESHDDDSIFFSDTIVLTNRNGVMVSMN